MKIEVVMGEVNEISGVKVNNFCVDGLPKRGKKKLTDIELTRSLISRLKKQEILHESGELMLALILKIAERLNKKSEILEEKDRVQTASLKARKERIKELEAKTKDIIKAEITSALVNHIIISQINSNAGGLRDVLKAVKK